MIYIVFFNTMTMSILLAIQHCQSSFASFYFRKLLLSILTIHLYQCIAITEGCYQFRAISKNNKNFIPIILKMISAGPIISKFKVQWSEGPKHLYYWHLKTLPKMFHFLYNYFELRYFILQYINHKITDLKPV